MDLLLVHGAIGRLGSMGFQCQSLQTYCCCWTCGARTLDQRAGLAGAIQTPPGRSPPPPPPASHLLPLHQRLTGRTLAGCLYGGSHSVHCTLYTVLCCMCTLYSPSPPLVPLQGHGGDLQLAAFIHRYTTRARPGSAHKRLLQLEGGALRLIILCCLPNYRLNKTQ